MNRVEEGKVKVDESEEEVYHLYIHGLIMEFWLIRFRTFFFSWYEDIKNNIGHQI